MNTEIRENPIGNLRLDAKLRIHLYLTFLFYISLSIQESRLQSKCRKTVENDFLNAKSTSINVIYLYM